MTAAAALTATKDAQLAKVRAEIESAIVVEQTAINRQYLFTETQSILTGEGYTVTQDTETLIYTISWA